MAAGITGLVIIGLWIALIVGWILNIVAVAGADFAVITGLLVLRIIGIFVAPLGGVLGLFC